VGSFLSTETLVIELLLIASLVAIVVRRLQVPYTVALVVVGLLLTTQSPLQVELTPELINGNLDPQGMSPTRDFTRPTQRFHGSASGRGDFARGV
jgi:hypothetical protein